MPHGTIRSWSGYAAAVALPAFATAATLVLRQHVDMPPYWLFFATVALAALIGGLGPAVVAAILSAVFINLFLAPPPFSLQISQADLLRLISFLAVAGIIGGITLQRRHAESSRAESEERFRLMADAAPVLIWMSGPDKGGDYFNKAWLEFTGRTLQQEAGTGWMEGVHLDDQETLQICQNAFNNRESFEMEFRLRRHDGEYRWMLDRGIPRYSSSGEFLGYLGSCMDITERKAVEQALAEREARLAAILDTAVDGIITISERGIMESANSAAERIFGYRREEMIGQNVKMLMPSPDHEQHDQYLRNYLQTGHAKIIGIGREVVGLRKDGSTFPMDLGVSEMRFNRRRMFTGIVRDISATKQAERNLSQSEERFRLLFEHSPVGVAISRHAKLLFANSALVSMFGYEQVEELLGRPVLDLVAPELREMIRGRMMKRERGEQVSSDYEAIGLRKDGSRFPYMVQARRIELPDGPATIAFLIDITQRKQAEQELHDSQERLQAALTEAQRANRIKDEFLATLSHELRTPLNAILGWAQLLRIGRLDESEVNQGLETIERNAHVQSQLIEDLLDVSRIITGRLWLDVRPVELPPIIDAAIAAVQPAADAKQIHLKPAYHPSTSPILGDPARLQQVVWNLLSNAIKFTPRGGSVDVTLGQSESQVEITVRDTGCGIDPEFLPYVFERFRQADASTTRKHGGLGLGLAIVRHLVELHGGDIQAHSEGEGKGATFLVRLPIAAVREGDQRTIPDVAATVDSSALQRVPSLSGLRVLVVDDERDARHLITTVLHRCGAEVITASSAREALHLLDRQPPDVLVSDIGMPGEDGFHLIRRLRAMENHHARLPAVALTAYARTQDRLQALAAGFQMHLAKPVNPAELAAVIGSLAGRTGGYSNKKRE